MGNAIYARYSDDVSTGSVTVETGTPATGYPATNLVDLNPANPAKLNETSGAWLFDYGSPRSLDLAAFIHHNLSAGANLFLQGNATNTWGSPTLSVGTTIPAYHEDGFPLNPWIDLTGISPRSFRYWRVAVLSAQPNPIALGEVVLIATKRSLINNYADGAQDGDAHPLIEHTTAGGVVRTYDIGVKRRHFSGQIGLTADAGWAAMIAAHRDARGRARPFLWIPDPAVNDAWWVRFASPTLERTLEQVNLNSVSFALEELSRGLPL